MTVDYDSVLRDIYTDVRSAKPEGKVADYIAPLACVPPDSFGMTVFSLDGAYHEVGDVLSPFSAQSVTKVFTAAMVLSHHDILLWDRVGVEPSGTKFNSLIQLESERGIPRNPLINAGAIVVADELCGLYDNPKQSVLDFVREVSDDSSIEFDPEVAQCEFDTGFTNFALANLMKANGNLRHGVDRVLDLYFHQCSIAMSTRSLARAYGFLANQGVIPSTNGRRVLSKEQCRRLNAVMLTCGFYDQAGEFAYQVGLPGKSGVGGGIAVVAPGDMSAAVWGPRLNEYGNSTAGLRALVQLTTRTGLSIFG